MLWVGIGKPSDGDEEESLGCIGRPWDHHLEVFETIDTDETSHLTAVRRHILDAKIFDARARAACAYDAFVVKNRAGADRFAEYGECEPKCPQKISITEKLREAHEYLTTS